MNIRPVGAELFHVGMKITVAFRDVANAPKNGIRALSCALYTENLISNSL
jgi:hypothetical protein